MISLCNEPHSRWLGLVLRSSVLYWVIKPVLETFPDLVFRDGRDFVGQLMLDLRADDESH